MDIAKYILIALISVHFTSSGQNRNAVNTKSEKISITGNVVFENSNEKPPGVNIYFENTTIGATTDYQGYFKITNIENGEYVLIAQFIGYEKYSRKILVNKDLHLNIILKKTAVIFDEISIIADKLIDRSSVSDISLSTTEIDSYKGLQADPVNTLSLMPGITKGNNDLFSSTQMYVRGGAPDENLFLYNNVKVYWPWYSGGIKSIFNNEVLQDMELLTGGFSAKYGNAMSSVMRVTTRDGKYDNFGGNFTFGFSGLQSTVEGPLKKEKVSVLLSVRKTYLDLILGDKAKFPNTNIMDGTYKVAWKLNEKHKLSLSGLSSREKLDFVAFDPKPGMPNEMNTFLISHNQSLQLQSMWSEKLYTNLSLYNSVTNSIFSLGENINMDLKGTDLGIREDATYRISHKHKINFGIDASLHYFRNKGKMPLDMTTIDYNDTTILLREIGINSKSNQFGSYISYSGNIFKRLSITAGIRSDYFYFENDFTNINYSPRISFKYSLASKTSLRASSGYFYQFPEVDELEKNKNLKSNLCKHYILGVEHNFNSFFRTWIEAYYKDYENLVVYNTETGMPDDIIYSNLGSGYVKGIELFLFKKKGRFSGWISYAYSIAKRRQSLQDHLYYFEYDKPHMLSFASQYIISEKTSYFIPHLISAQFRFESGNPYTPLTGAVMTPIGWQPIKGEINSERNPAFHNLSIKIVWLMKESKLIKIKSFLEVWNVYNHKNLLGRNYQYGTEYDNNIKINKYYSTPFLPSGGVRIEF
jgi:hypothetical protein